MNSGNFNILIVDDEAPARKLLEEYVQKVPFLTLAGSCSNAFEAMSVLRKKRVDIILLDIQMPDLTGIEFVESLKNPPAIILTTAYSEYALKSYELPHIVDYLLKPFPFIRFLQAINKVKELAMLFEAGNGGEPVEKNPDGENPALLTDSSVDYIIIKTGHKILKINYSDIVYIEGQREYVTFHTSHQHITAYYALKKLEEELPEDIFLRVHKSFIVSFKYIESVEGNILTVAGEKIPVGGIFRDNLMQRLLRQVKNK